MTNTKLEVKIVDLETGKEIVRNANVDELAQIEIDEANYKALLACPAIILFSVNQVITLLKSLWRCAFSIYSNVGCVGHDPLYFTSSFDHSCL